MKSSRAVALMPPTMKTKKAMSRYLSRAQRNVEPAGQDEVASEELAAQLPEVFGEGSDGAEPGAEGALEEEAGGGEDEEQDHGGGVDGGDAAGGDEVARVHQSGDGEPAIDSGGAGDVGAGGAGFKVADEEIELDAEEDVEQDEEALHDEAGALPAVGRGAANVGLFRFGCGDSAGVMVSTRFDMMKVWRKNPAF